MRTVVFVANLLIASASDGALASNVANSSREVTCMAPVMTLSKIDMTARNSSESLREREADPEYQNPTLAAHMEHVRWNADYWETMVEVANGGQEGTEKRIRTLSASARRGDADDARAMLAMFEFIHDSPTLRISISTEEFGRYVKDVADHTAENDALMSKLLQPIAESAPDHLALYGYMITYGELLGEPEPIRQAIDGIQTIRNAKGRTDPEQDLGPYAGYLAGTGWLTLAKMTGLADDFHRAKDLLSKSLDDFGMSCPITSSEVALRLAETYAEMASRARDNPAKVHDSLSSALNAIEKAQHFADPLETPERWKVVYSTSSDLYNAAAAVSPSDVAASQYRFLAQRAADVSL